MKNKPETEKWRQIFASILKLVFSHYNLKDIEFAHMYKCDVSATRNWKNARSFPSKDLFEYLKQYILEKTMSYKADDTYLRDRIEAIFSEYGYGTFYIHLKYDTTNNAEFIIRVLQSCIDAGKGNIIMPIENNDTYISDHRTHAVVFDFDGTLTKSGKIAKTTWENIWVSLGYDVKVCQNLHKRFDRKEITHEEWCKLTEEKFKARNLHRDTLKTIANKIHLIKGVKRTFQQLNEHDIKIYIVSGSIMFVIQAVLGNLNRYVDNIRANQLMFNEAGFLTQIIGTKYDFEGKADYIVQIANELKISTKDILFVGNSRNDHFAYQSGARTLCINPRLTDITDTQVWNECIETCDDLTEILDYI